MARFVSLAVILGIVILVGVLFFRVMASFLLPMFIAVLFVVMFRPLHSWMVLRCKGRLRLAAGLTTGLILLIVLLPLIGVGTRAAIDGYRLVTGIDVQFDREAWDKMITRQGLWIARDDDWRTIDELLLIYRYQPAERVIKDREKIVPKLRDVLKTAKQILRENVEYRNSYLRGESREAELLDLEDLETEAQPFYDSIDELIAELIREPNGDQADAAQANGEKKDEGISEAAREIEREKLVASLTNNVQREFQNYQAIVLGGRFTSWMKIWANPSKEQFDRVWSSIATKARELSQDVALGTTQILGGLSIGLFVLTISLYYFLADGPSMVEAIMRLSPIDERYERQLIAEFDKVSRAVVLATLLSAVVQGLLAGLGYFVVGLEPVLLLTLLTGFLSLIPFVGAGAVWVPCSLWLYMSHGQTGAAIGLALYGFFVVSLADNLVKPWVLHGQTNLHPLLALLSVIGGVQALGPIGIFVGPMLVAFLQALLNILNTELKEG